MAAAVANPTEVPNQQAEYLSQQYISQNQPVSSPVAPQGQSPQPVISAASLYVGDLLPDMSEASLFPTFNTIGPVASIKVCRDAITKKSLGYAYVNFHSIHDAEKAIELLNHASIDGKPCRIMWSQRDPTQRRNGVGNIFIKNLEQNIDNKALHDTFSSFGNILSCKVATDENNMSKGYGFVHYENPESAEQAIQDINGMLLNDKKVFVGFHVPKQKRESRINELRANFTNIFAKELDPTISDDELYAMFSPFGTIISAAVAKNPDGSSKLFGFVNFESHDAAAKAVQDMDGKEVKGKALYVARAQKKSEREEELRRRYEQAKMEKISRSQDVNVYVKNLEDDVDDLKLQEMFAPYGTITSAKVMRDEKGLSKGFGFVCFASPVEAKAAVKENQGKLVGTKPIYCNFAQRKDVRRSILEQQRQNRQMQQAFAMGPGLPPGVNHGALGLPPMGLYGGPGPMYITNPVSGMPIGRIPQYYAAQPNVGNKRYQGPPQHPAMMGNRQNGMMVQNMSPNGPINYPVMNGQPRPILNQQITSPQQNNRPLRRQQIQNSNGQKPNYPPPQFGMPPQAMNPVLMNQHMQHFQNVPANVQSGPRRGGYKFAPTARNNKDVMPIIQSNPSGQHLQRPVENMGPNMSDGPLNPSVLATYPIETVKEILGETLYKKVRKWVVENGQEQDLSGVPKITGMLLEVDTSEILNLLDNEEELNQQISEALSTWKIHLQQAQESQNENQV